MPLRQRKTRRGMITLASLADVIFLLLLYFILTSTFSRFGEMELMSGSAGAAVSAPADDRRMLFVQVAPGAVTLNGAPTAPAALRDAVAALLPEGAQAQAILSLQDGVNAQEMTDVLVILRRVPGVSVTVIG